MTFAITKYELVGARRRLWVQASDNGRATEEEVWLTDAENAAVALNPQAIDAIAADYCVQVGSSFQEALASVPAPPPAVQELAPPVADSIALTARLPKGGK